MTAATVHRDGRLVFQGNQFRAALGRGGVRTDKQEGDGSTPAGLLPIRRILYRADRGPAPACGFRREPIAETDGWCNDPTHRDYNRAITLPFTSGHEALWRRDELYDIVVVLGWNDAPVLRPRGSAIFLHVAQPDLAPTDGCVALSAADLRNVLARGLTALNVVPAA
jgi:L,D-peptidoglycan transpeptidase YkuD (ErfK/YbiS/YcfS/YnhG family)